MTRITVQHIRHSYRLKDAPNQRLTVLDDISLKVNEGGSLALMGPSGCGKTTLLRMIAGLESPDEGRILYDETPIDTVPRRERNIGMIFQNYALIPHWKSERTIGFFLRLRGRQREVPERVKQVAQITGVGIDHLLEKQPRQLSGGEKQRVAIARAFSRDLRVLLLDEPFANLDAKQRTHARVEVRRLLNEFDITTVLATHDQQEAASLADRIVLMRAGRIVQVGTYESLHDDPRNTFVAQFVGTPTMNLIDGIAQDGRWQGATFGGYPLPVTVPDDTRVQLGVRPNHIHLVAANDDADFSVTVADRTQHYAERYTLLDVRLTQTPEPITLQIQTSLETPVRTGDTVFAVLDTSALYFFDAASGDRLTATPYRHA